MWNTVFATAVAAAVGLVLVNVASQLSKIQDARHQLHVEHAQQDRGIPSKQIPRPGIDGQKSSAPGV